MASRLEEVRAGLEVDEEDVGAIRREASRRRLRTRIIVLLTPLLSFIGGFAAGGLLDRPDPVSSYPYVACASSMLSDKAISGRNKATIIGATLVSAVAFIVGFVLGSDDIGVFGYGTMYGVFHS